MKIVLASCIVKREVIELNYKMAGRLILLCFTTVSVVFCNSIDPKNEAEMEANDPNLDLMMMLLKSLQEQIQNLKKTVDGKDQQ